MNEDSHSPGTRAPSAALLGPRASGPPSGPEARGPRRRPISPARIAAHALIRSYQLALSGLFGRQCRYLPTCSAYTDEAIARHGVWAGGWMGAARICRCHPLGGAGYDPPPQAPHAGASWLRPWRYGQWRAPAAAD